MSEFARTAGTERVLNALRLLPASGGIGLITGPAVSGKTTAIRRAMAELPYVRRVDPTPAPAGASPRAFYRELAMRLNLPVRGCDGAIEIEQRIEQHICGGRLLLVIDQCEEMPQSWVRCLRHLADALGSLVLVGPETLLDRVQGHAGLAGRVRLPVQVPAPTLAEVAAFWGEEFDQEWIAETYELGRGLWGELASMAELQRSFSAGLKRLPREARADDARHLSKFLVRAVA